MSFVTTQPEELTAAASSLQAIDSAMTAQNAAAAMPITAVAPAAADEISALQATQFSAYGKLYEQISAQAAAIQDMFVHTLRVSADSYGATEAANSAAASSATGLGAAGLGAAGLSPVAAADPTFGLGGIASNAAILAAMQGANFGSAASEFTGLGKGYITNPPGVIHSVNDATQATLAAQAAPAGSAAAAGPVSAAAGQASSVGKLSVPPTWAGEAAAASGRPTIAGAGLTNAEPHSVAATTVPAGLPAMATSERGGFGFGRPRYGVKPTVMPRRPVV